MALAFLSPWLQFFSVLWPLLASATVICWQLLFRLLCTPCSLTKKLLIYSLLLNTWKIPSCSLILSLGPCLLTLQMFSLLCPGSLSCFQSAPQCSSATPPLAFSQLCPLTCLYFGSFMSWSINFTGRKTRAQISWLLKIIYEVHDRKEIPVFMSGIQSFSWRTPPLQICPLDLMPWWFLVSAGSVFSIKTIASCFFLTMFDSEFFGNEISVFIFAKHPVHLYSAI